MSIWGQAVIIIAVACENSEKQLVRKQRASAR